MSRTLGQSGSLAEDADVCVWGGGACVRVCMCAAERDQRGGGGAAGVRYVTDDGGYEWPTSHTIPSHCT